MNNCRTRGLVLAVNDYGEADKIVTFLSPELGRVTGIAKGAKRSKQRFVNKLEVFSLLEILYRPSRNDSLLFIIEAELENAFLCLRKDYSRYVIAMYATELVLRFTREHDPDISVFSLLHWMMHMLETGNDPLRTGALFHLRLIGSAGYRPGLDRCGLCGTDVSSETSFFLHQGTGSLVCANCRKPANTLPVPLSLQTLKFLEYAQRMELKNMERLRLPAKNAREALYYLYQYSRHLLQHDVSSWPQMQTLLENGIHKEKIQVYSNGGKFNQGR